MVGMSGGVDSSVAAFLLQEQGYHVEGIFMKNWEQDDTEDFCPATKDMEDAQAVSDQLGIELHRVNFAADYWERVFIHFLSEYRAGRTPNPDILCNKEIKFNAFLNYAKGKGADYIATGHYARVNAEGHLLKGMDRQKDQSYFLYALSKEKLIQTLFPIGELEKKEVRAFAKKLGFKNHQKKDSTGICFIGERKFKEFLNQFLPAKPGEIKTTAGTIMGQHDGLMFYTLGQRQGLKIGGQKNSKHTPWYVIDKQLETNTLIVAQGQDHPLLYKDALLANQFHWINETPIKFPFSATAKTRYRQEDQSCIIDQQDNHQYQITFEKKQRAITPGQSVVLYQDDQCLGGGIIVG